MEVIAGNTSKISRAYGSACVECFKAKCKCTIVVEGEACDRCRRLKRECHPSTSKRKRQHTNNDAASSPASRANDAVGTTARLEQKIDALAASIRQHVPSGSSALRSESQSDASPSRFDLINSIDRYGVSPDEAEDYLNTFRTHHARYFPYVYIPADLTAAQLRNQRPYLWLAILTTGSYSVRRQQHLGDIFRREIAEAMVVRSEKSIDLLLGLLTFIGWFHNQFKVFRPEDGHPRTALSMLTQLAVSLVFDLHLSKPAVVDPHHGLGVRFFNHPDHPRHLTMEEIRAVLGCFFITSIISSYLQKTDALRWTSRLQDCLRQLDENRECEGDEILLQHVRMQLVIEKATLSSWYDTTFETSDQLRIPSLLVLQSSSAQLEHIRTNMPAHLLESNIVLAQLYSTELSIAETALWQNEPEGLQLSFSRQKVLLSCLSSTKAWLEILRTFSTMAYCAFPFSFASILTRCLGMVVHLSTLEEPGWDRDFVKSQVDIVQVMDDMVERLEEAIATFRIDGEEDVFSRHCFFWKSIKPGVLAKLDRQESSSDNTVAPTLDTANDAFGPDLLNWDFFDNEWISSMNWLGTGTQQQAL